MPSILASIAPPFWMLQNRLWTYFCITIIFYFCLFIISPWLFFIGWILKSWYVGNSQIDLLRFFYRLHNYRLSLSFCAKSDKEAQEIARKFDEKIDFIIISRAGCVRRLTLFTFHYINNSTFINFF